MRTNTVACLFACAALVMITGCSSTGSSQKSRYPVTASGAIQRVENGTIVATRTVKIDGRATNVGTAVGAGVGAAVGAIAVPRRQTTTISSPQPNVIQANTTSNRHESDAAMAVGGAVGVLAGRKVEKMLTARKAQELTIAMEGGETVMVVQEYREPEFMVNERVKVYTTRTGESVVYHSDEDPHLDPDTDAYVIPDDGEFGEDEFEPVEW
ncbi:hypothetical protein [Pelagicoccus sp. SDUM812003]|uniref:outer membrane lipoprotein n=1 Tax=Pelagicoccus sp. SDUM812003 TaxID=3041267 RepID=UPI0028105919|nr:hypothetical protein [Pelagicoccus sp. SDUM812003]MDQ8203379.1 hypothetical protein [Pelagicoccus sp. SDUM812003]